MLLERSKCSNCHFLVDPIHLCESTCVNCGADRCTFCAEKVCSSCRHRPVRTIYIPFWHVDPGGYELFGMDSRIVDVWRERIYRLSIN